MEQNIEKMNYFRNSIVNIVNNCDDMRILEFIEAFCRAYERKRKKEE